MTKPTWPAPPVYTMRPQDLVGREFDASGMRWRIVGSVLPPEGEKVPHRVLYWHASARLPEDPKELLTMRRETAEMLVKCAISHKRPPTPTPQPDETGSAT